MGSFTPAGAASEAGVLPGGSSQASGAAVWVPAGAAGLTETSAGQDTGAGGSPGAAGGPKAGDTALPVFYPSPGKVMGVSGWDGAVP